MVVTATLEEPRTCGRTVAGGVDGDVGRRRRRTVLFADGGVYSGVAGGSDGGPGDVCQWCGDGADGDGGVGSGGGV